MKRGPILLVIAAALALLTIGAFILRPHNDTNAKVYENRARLLQSTPDAPVLSPSQTAPAHNEYSEGQSMAKIDVPTLNAQWAMVEGVSPDSLDLGAGHYPFSALPGDIGNMSFACHRIRSLCLNVDRLSYGDPIIVTFEGKRYTYRVFTSYVVDPTQVSVVSSVPNKPGVQPTERLLTLTTCLRNEEGGNKKRFIVHARLTGVQ